MPLKLTLRAGERMILGGAVVRNDGETAHLTVENSVPILRSKDILAEADANSPCRRIYFNLQLIYIDENNLATHLRTHWQLCNEVTTAAPTTARFIEEIDGLLLRREYYRALKTAKKLIEYEDQLIGSV